jgi:RHS repeat-associated protein
MTHVTARRFALMLATVGVLASAYAVRAQPAPPATAVLSAQDKVMQLLTRGMGAREAIESLSGGVSASPDLGRAADARQLEAAQTQLEAALQSHRQGGRIDALKRPYDSWRAANLVIRLKLASEGERLKQSSDGAAYTARHDAAQAKVLAAFDEVQALLDPLFAPGVEISAARVRTAGAEALAALKRQRSRVAAAPILRAQAVPFGGLNLPPRPAALTPTVTPSYESPAENPPTAAERATSAYAPLNDEIVARAQALGNDYVRIYEFVRNTVRSEWYAGSAKGALGVLRSGSGNDVDQASLLTALLRAAGLHTRYVQGVVEIPVEQLAAGLGLPPAQASAVPSALVKAGIAVNPVVRGGRIAAVQVARTWVSAHVPYTNYRGVLVDASGKTWIPLDPFHKAVTLQSSSGFFGRTFVASDLAGDYESRPQAAAFGDYLKQRMTAALTGSGTAGSWESHRASTVVTPLQLDILPNTLPYVVVAVTREAAVVSDVELASVRIRLHRGNRAADPVVLDKTLPLADAINGRLTLSYGPASLEDHRVALLYGGMDAVPLYLINLRGELRLGGTRVALANDHVEPGSHLRMTVELRGPWGVQDVEQTLVAGAYHALVLGEPQRPQEIAASDEEQLGARLLDGLGVYYARQWTDADRNLSGWLDAGVVHPLPTLTIVSTTVKPSLVAGVPVTLEWTGVSIDAALRPVDAVGERAQEFLALSALAGSSLEQAVFREQFSVEAISADRGMQLANERQIPILVLTGSNIASLDATDHGDVVKAAVRELVRQGHRVRIPASTLVVRAWTGSVWQAFKDGRAGYFLSGGIAGGETVDPPDAWTLGFLADALRAMHSEEPNNDPQSGAYLLKVGAVDGQRGVVGQPVPTPFSVRVQDRTGRPVRGASVSFTVDTGDAQFGNGGASITVLTNHLGIASPLVTLGRSTHVNPVWVMRDPADETATQAGYITVSAHADSTSGRLRTEEPFEVYSLPDVLARLETSAPATSGGLPSMDAGVLSLGTVDQFGNPVANVSVTVSMDSLASCAADGPPNRFRPGVVYDGSVRANACPASPVLGQCGAPSVSLRSVSNGVVFAGVILSNEIGGTNTVRATGPNGISREFTFTAAGVCVPSRSEVTYAAWGTISGGEYDADGNLLSAALPGRPVPGSYQITLYQDDYPYFYDAQGRVRFQPYTNVIPATGTINGVTATAGASATLTGSNVFTVQTGPAPGFFSALPAASVTVNGIRNTQNGPENFTQVINVGGPTGSWGVGFFGVHPAITEVVSRDVPAGVDPARIHLDRAGASLYPIELRYRVEPSSYRNARNAWTVDILRDGVAFNFAIGNSRSGTGAAILERSVTFGPAQSRFEAQLSTRHTHTRLESEPFALPLRQKLIASLSASGMSQQIDVANQRVCGRTGTVNFVLTREARGAITYQMLGDNDAPLGSPQELVPEATYPQGANEVQVNPSRLGTGRFEIALNATATGDASVVDSATTTTSSRYGIANALPVGQVLVQGVNVRNGILTHQTPRLGIPGRGIPFEFVSTYSSAAAGEISTNGANWVHNHDLGLTINACGEATVSAGDSGSVRFFPGPNGTMVPDKGYHGTLVANPTDNSWDFYSKDGTQYHYRFFNHRVQWKLERITDRNGNTQTYEYDLNAFPEPLLSRVVRNDGRSLAFSYTHRGVQRPGRGGTSMQHLLTRVEGNAGQVVRLDYDLLGNLTSQAVNGRETTYAYSTEEPVIADRYRLITATDARRDVTRYEYLVAPRDVSNGSATVRLDHLAVRQITSPMGGTTQFTIDQNTWLSSTVTNAPGNGTPSGVTNYTFNNFGNPLTIADPAGTTAMEWETATDVLMRSKTDGRQVRTEYEYDAHGNQTVVRVGGASTVTTYEIQTVRPFSKSRVTSRTDRNGRRTDYDLDPQSGNVLFERLPIGRIGHEYLPNGDRSATTDANGHTTRFEYDAYGNQDAVIAPSGARTETRHDARGRVDRIVDGRRNRTTIEYDNQDNPFRQTNARGDVKRRTFDQLGNKLDEQDEEGRTTTWTYFPGSLVRTITVTGPGGPAERSFIYDGAGNKRSETDWLGRTTIYAYDSSQRLENRLEPRDKLTTYAYDAVGNLLRETTGARVTTHTYDAMGRRETTRDAEQHLWTTEYDHNGNRTATIDPLGRRTVMVYDAMNRLREVNQPLGRSTRFDYDDGGNKTRETDPNGNVTEYRYDVDNRLRRTIRADATEVAYEYDNANNMFRQTDAGGGITQHTFDELNRKDSTRDAEGHTTTYGYDRVGNLVRETWPNGNVLTHAYDLFNRRTSTSDTVGSVGSWEYDHNGNLRAETDGNGNRTTHSYDDLNYRTGSTLPGSRTLGYEPDVFGNVEGATDARGHRTSHAYDRLNRLRRSTFADGGQTTVDYDPAGNKTAETDPLGHPTAYAVNALNRVTHITDMLGGQIVNTYDNVGNLRFQTNKRGVVTEQRYDSMNRLRSTIKADIEIEALTYTRLGQVETRTDANRNVVTYEHDRRGLVTSERAPEGATTLSPRNAMGDVERATDPEGRVTVTAFDARRRVRTVTNPANETTAYGYDLNNHKTTVTRPSGAQTVYTYDHRNMLTAVAEPLSRTTLYGRDNNGNLTSVTDGNTRVTGYGYDRMNRRASVTYPGGTAETFAHDHAGNLRTHTDANGITITRHYDDLNREVRKTYSSSADGLQEIATTYDRNNNPETVTETYGSGSPRVTTTVYDAFDRPSRVTDGFGARMDFSYDLNGNRLTLSTQDARVTRYSYDGLNRLRAMTSPAGGVQHRYDRSGLVVEKIWSNGTGTATSHDAAQRPTRIVLSRAGAPLNLTEYRYDPNGNRTEERINRPAGAQLTTYRYDAADRLTGTLRVEGANSADTTWTYDLADNRLTETVVTTGAGAGTVTRGYTYNPRNQLTNITDSAAGATTLAYDPQGNLLRKEQGSDTTNFVWSARDLLASVSRNGTVLGRYGSDHTGMRVSKEALNPLQPGAPPRVLRTQWDDENAVQDRDTAGTVIARYDFAGGQPIALWSQEDGNQLLHADALGSVIATTVADGSVKSETLYDAWGNPVLRTGISANKFAYTGHQADPETGLYYFKARYYDPVIGRFISQDPMEGLDDEPASYHRYLYAYGNPLFYTDPTGMYSWSEFGEDAWSYTARSSGVLYGMGKSVVVGAYEGVVTIGAGYAMFAHVASNGRLFKSAYERTSAFSDAVTSPVQTAKAVADHLGEEFSGGASDISKGDAFSGGARIGGATTDVAMLLTGAAGAAKSTIKVTTKTATTVSTTLEGQAAQAALRGTATPASVGATVTESTVARHGGRLSAEGTSGMAAESGSARVVGSVEAKISPEVAKAVDQPMFAGGGASSLTRRQYIEANVRESAAAREAGPAPIQASAEQPRGIRMTTEGKSHRNPDSQRFEDSIEGTTYDIATRRRNTPALQYTNPNKRGKNEIRFDGQDPHDPNVLIDRKWNVTTKPKQVSDIQRWMSALGQNEGVSVRIEVPSEVVQRKAEVLLKKAGADTQRIRIKVVK